MNMNQFHIHIDIINKIISLQNNDLHHIFNVINIQNNVLYNSII
mgnify:CR=1 FL=1